MADDRDRLEELEAENDRLRDEVDRYRTATEDALQQLDWCIGYFVGSNKGGLAKSLGENRSYIRKNLLGRASQGVPASEDGSSPESSEETA